MMDYAKKDQERRLYQSIDAVSSQTFPSILKVWVVSKLCFMQPGSDFCHPSTYLYNILFNDLDL